jgi:Flp pilus assembly protein TadG
LVQSLVFDLLVADVFANYRLIPPYSRDPVPSGEEGASLVETAISASALFLLLIGIIEMSLASYAYNFVSDAAREASRWAIVRGSTCYTNTKSSAGCMSTTGTAASDITNYVKNLSHPSLDSSKLTVNVNWCAASAGTPKTWAACTTSTANKPRNQVQVTVQYAFPIAIPFWRRDTFNVTSTSQTTIQQ